MTPRLARIFRHPVKSLGWEALERVRLDPGAGLPFDRRWALLHGGGRFETGWAACRNFARVTHAPALAQVAARYDEAAGRLRLDHPQAGALEADPDAAEGAAAIAAWAAPLAADGPPGPYRLVASARALTDTDFPSVSVLSLASLRALGERIGAALDPRSFRGNLWLDGLAPWEEAAWPGREIAIGAARLRIVEPIGRCAAIEASPESGRRDVATLAGLRAAVGGLEFGLYAEVVAGGVVACGDAVDAAG